MKNEMNKLFVAFVIMALSGLVCFHVISAAEEVNYSTSPDYGGIQVASLKYEPYPANPGEYVDVWIKAKIGSSVDYAKFEFVGNFPFSLDSNENPVREYEDFSGDVVMHYKVRVDEDAVEGDNELKIKISSSESFKGSFYPMEIYVADAQTDFDLVVQDSTTSEISLAIANIGKNTANSMIVRIPIQEGYGVTGTNGQMVGNLESGDYTIVSFTLSTTRNSQGILEVQIDYTDNIGVRRSVVKEVQLVSSGFASSSANYSSSSGRQMPDGFIPGGNFPGMQAKKPKWPYFLAGGLILVIVGFLLYSKYKKQIKHFLKKEKKNKLKQETSEVNIPEWIKKIKEKEKK